MYKAIPTAKEFYRTYQGWITTKMIEFAKLHVKAALEAAYENAEVVDGWNTGFSGNSPSINKDSILNAYPLTNIE